ncbi:MAG: hypothetical protein KJ649_08800 [Proteobacteria bacterium]|nr:hypothetical protein [Pseudomonadota bacterium]MBU1744976.1 hypothetical protein [Pseudomonadota bacterium]
MKISFSAIAMLLMLYGCGGSITSTSYRENRIACTNSQGIIETSTDANGNEIEICKYQEAAISDDGTHTLTIECPLKDFFNGQCNDDYGEDVNYTSDPPVGTCPTCSKTVREMLDDQMTDILLKLDNTGYTHNSHRAPNESSTFDLHPDYTALKNQTETNPISKYDLFLDCSGLVGYYVLQGIAESLFEKIPKNYSCTRPLAADFVDLAESSAAFAGTEATSTATACWSRVEHIKYAKPGDVIAYRHDGLNFENKLCPDGRTVNQEKDHKSTGHVMFVHDWPYRSTEKKDDNITYKTITLPNGQTLQVVDQDNRQYQWIVQVADSTNATHTADSRKKGAGNSVYGSNTYHAWMAGTEGYVQLCADGSYHRDCSAHSTSRDPNVSNIMIDAPTDSNHLYGYHPTGVGAGKLYVNDSMDGYRVRKSHSITKATVVLLRPVPCD